MGYIRGSERPAGCVFCDAPRQADADALIVARAQHVYVILNRYPYNAGHLMIVPYAHVASQEALEPAALAECMTTLNRALGALRALYNPPAFNWGANLSAAAGAGIAEHFHLHVVPRWGGDANFMTTIAQTRVIPDELPNTQRELSAVWQRLYGDGNAGGGSALAPE
jgi:ATP adenylyltransferase